MYIYPTTLPPSSIDPSTSSSFSPPMAKLLCSLVLLAISALSSVAAAAATSTSVKAAAPPPADCSNVEMSLLSCLDFLQAGSNSSTPTKECCTAASTVIKSSPQCICAAIKDYSDLLNITRALALPSACNVVAPHLPCKVPGAPSPAPTPASKPSSPAPGQKPSPGLPPTPGSKTRPSAPALAPSEAPTLRACVFIISSLSAIIFSILKS